MRFASEVTKSYVPDAATLAIFSKRAICDLLKMESVSGRNTEAAHSSGSETSSNE